MSKISVGDKVRVYGFAVNYDEAPTLFSGSSAIVAQIQGIMCVVLRKHPNGEEQEYSVHIKQCRRWVKYRKCEQCEEFDIDGESWINLKDTCGKDKTFLINCTACNGKGKVEVI